MHGVVFFSRSFFGLNPCYEVFISKGGCYVEICGCSGRSIYYMCSIDHSCRREYQRYLEGGFRRFSSYQHSTHLCPDQGTINGNTVEYPMICNKPYPDWKGNGADGQHVLTLSADGKKVTGKWYNNNRDSGPTSNVEQKLCERERDG